MNFAAVQSISYKNDDSRKKHTNYLEDQNDGQFDHFQTGIQVENELNQKGPENDSQNDKPKNPNYGNFNIRRSCLSEIRLISRPKQLSIIGFRQPEDWQYADSRNIKPKQLKSQKAFYEEERSQRNLDFLQAILSMFGLIIQMVNYEDIIFNYDIEGIDIKKYPDASKHPRVISDNSCIVRCIVTFTSIISIACLFRREQLRAKWMKKYFNLEERQHPTQVEYMHLDEEEDFMEDRDKLKVKIGFGSFLSSQFLFEVLLNSLIPLPFYDMYITLEASPPDSNDKKAYTYLLSDFMLAIMVLRIAFMIRAVMKFNIYNQSYAMKLFRSYGHDTSPLFTMKALLQLKPEITCMVLFFSTSVIFAYWVRIFEIPYQRATGDPQFDDFSKAMWFTIITLFTVGYGDYFPCTMPGKIVTALLAFWGAILLALVVVSISNIFSIEGKNKVALSHLQVTNSAAKTIQASMRYFIAKKRSYMLQFKKGEIDRDNAFLKMMQTNSTSTNTAADSTQDHSRMEFSEFSSSPQPDEVYYSREGGEKDTNQADYFQRQIQKFSKIEANDKVISKAKKIEDMTWRKFIVVLQYFKDERESFEKDTTEEMPNSNFSQKMIANEMQDTSDRVKEIMRVLSVQQEMMKNQQLLIQQQQSTMNEIKMQIRYQQEDKNFNFNSVKENHVIYQSKSNRYSDIYPSKQSDDGTNLQQMQAQEMQGNKQSMLLQEIHDALEQPSNIKINKRLSLQSKQTGQQFNDLQQVQAQKVQQTRKPMGDLSLFNKKNRESFNQQQQIRSHYGMRLTELSSNSVTQDQMKNPFAQQQEIFARNSMMNPMYEAFNNRNAHDKSKSTDKSQSFIGGFHQQTPPHQRIIASQDQIQDRSKRDDPMNNDSEQEQLYQRQSISQPNQQRKSYDTHQAKSNMYQNYRQQPNKSNDRHQYEGGQSMERSSDMADTNCQDQQVQKDGMKQVMDFVVDQFMSLAPHDASDEQLHLTKNDHTTPLMHNNFK